MLRQATRTLLVLTPILGLSCYEESGLTGGLPCTVDEGCDSPFVCTQGFCLMEGETVLDDCGDGEQQKAEFCYPAEGRIEVTLPGVTGRFLGQGDFNGDGIVDFAGMVNMEVFTAVFSGGQYERTKIFDQPEVLKLYGLSVGDIDGDGFDDIMVMTDGEDFFVQTNAYLGNGTGTQFSEPVQSNVFIEGEMTEAVMGDFNGDTIPDAFFTDRDEGLKGYLVPGTGGGAFGPGEQIMSGTNLGDRFQAAELNGDGVMDIIYMQRDHDLVSVLLSEPFTPAMRIFTPTLALQLQTDVRPNDVIVRDINGDDVPDLAISHADSPVVLLFIGDFSRDEIYRQEDVTRFDLPEPGGAAFADLDGDGEINLVSAGATHTRFLTAWGFLDFGIPVDGELRNVARLNLTKANNDDIPDFLVHEIVDGNRFKMFLYTAQP